MIGITNRKDYDDLTTATLAAQEVRAKGARAVLIEWTLVSHEIAGVEKRFEVHTCSTDEEVRGSAMSAEYGPSDSMFSVDVEELLAEGETETDVDFTQSSGCSISARIVLFS